MCFRLSCNLQQRAIDAKEAALMHGLFRFMKYREIYSSQVHSTGSNWPGPLTRNVAVAGTVAEPV